MLARCFALVALLAAAPAVAQTPITACGSYGAGNYTLAADLEVASGDCLTFLGDVTLAAGTGDEVRSTATGNAWDYGVKHSGGVLNMSGIAIRGFRVGLKASGPNSILADLTFTGNRYFGVWITGNGTKMTGGSVASIGGVTDETYAIGIQAAANNVQISGVTFRNIYRQARGPGSLGDHLGEGLAVNFPASTIGGKLLNSTFSNDEFVVDTIGAFLGAGGGHSVDGFKLHNILRPVQRATANNSDITNVVATISTAGDDQEPIVGPVLNRQMVERDRSAATVQP